MGYNTNADRLLDRVNKALRVGACGAILINDTAAKTGKFSAITAVGTADVVLDATTASDITDFDVDVTIPKGVTIFGNFTSIVVNSGVAIAYKSCD